MLRDYISLWGIQVSFLKQYSKKYRFLFSMLILADIIAIFGSTAFLYYMHISYEVYGFMVVFVAFGVHFTADKFLNVNSWLAYKFYRKNSSCVVSQKTYNLDTEKLYQILYSMGYKRATVGKSFVEYKEILLSACCENSKYAKLFCSYAEPYEADNGNVTCAIISKSNSNYLVDFIKEDITDGNRTDDSAGSTGVDEHDSGKAD